MDYLHGHLAEAYFHDLQRQRARAASEPADQATAGEERSSGSSLMAGNDFAHAAESMALILLASHRRLR